jgi:hypothetical protein
MTVDAPLGTDLGNCCCQDGRGRSTDIQTVCPALTQALPKPGPLQKKKRQNSDLIVLKVLLFRGLFNEDFSAAE